jgi:hypothetical protein
MSTGAAADISVTEVSASMRTNISPGKGRCETDGIAVVGNPHVAAIAPAILDPPRAAAVVPAHQDDRMVDCGARGIFIKHKPELRSSSVVLRDDLGISETTGFGMRKHGAPALFSVAGPVETRHDDAERAVHVQHPRRTEFHGTRESLVERTRAGLVAAAARGRRGGRPAALDESKIRAAKAMLASGNMSAIEVAQQLGCAPSTLYRHLPGGRSAIDQAAV